MWNKTPDHSQLIQTQERWEKRRITYTARATAHPLKIHSKLDRGCWYTMMRTPTLSLTHAILGRNFIIWPLVEKCQQNECELTFASTLQFDLSINKKLKDIRKFWQGLTPCQIMTSREDSHLIFRSCISAWSIPAESGCSELPMGSHWPPADKSHLTWVHSFRSRYRLSDSSGLV